MTKFGITKNPSDILEGIAQKHKILRKQQGLSQQELAKRSGVSYGSIKRFETSGQISFESLLKLALILNRMNDFDLIFTSQDDLEKVEKLFSDKTRA